MNRQDKSGIDYKAKYLDLRARFIESLDLAFRQGFAQGQMEAQMEAANQQMQMAMQMQQSQAQQAQGQAMPGQEGQPQEEQSQDAAQGGSELDQMIGELEGLVNKSELTKEDLKKSIDKIKEAKMHSELLKGIKFAGKIFNQKLNLNKNEKMSNSYTVNMPEEDKKAVAVQQKIVEDIFKKWSNESSDTGNKIAQTLSTEALTKKE